MEHLRIKFGDPNCIDVRDIVRKTGRQTAMKILSATAVGVGN